MKPYDVIPYWIDAGKKPIKIRPWFEKQEKKILKTLQNLQFNSVLEIGCGDGRITSMILKNFHVKKYHAIDVSPDRIERTKMSISKHVNSSSVKFTKTSFEDFLIKQKYDLVIAVEVLMHIPSQEIVSFITKMTKASRKYVLNVDYYPRPGYEWKNQFNRNFSHQYPSIYDNVNSNNHHHEITIKRIINKQSLFCVIKS